LGARRTVLLGMDSIAISWVMASVSWEWVWVKHKLPQ